jgi:hypothetical protein
LKEKQRKDRLAFIIFSLFPLWLLLLYCGAQGTESETEPNKAKFRYDSAIRNLKCTGTGVFYSFSLQQMQKCSASAAGQNKLSLSTTCFGGVNSTSTILLMS